MPSPISKLPRDERQALLDDLNYLNSAEIKTFCKRHSIPYTIGLPAQGRRGAKSKECDRKGVILRRIRHFLQTGNVLPQTRFSSSVICFDALPIKLAPDDQLFYGQYEKKNRKLLAALRDLTNGNFREGAIARVVLREFWSNGKAPTLKELAAAWLQASNEHTAPNPEWAFLSDLSRKADTNDWKKMRAKKAAQVIKTLHRICPEP